MKELNFLSDEVAHRLAAGEVVERPASCLKEVIENSIDASATLIDIKLENGGIKKIEVYDNGRGIHSEDIEYVFRRHTTSKIKSVDDIFRIRTMGFRGEALCAISSVSKVTLVSRHFSEDSGNIIRVEGGKIISKSEYPFEKGTKIIIEDLFYNTPARLKFLKLPSTEQKYCTEVVERLALCYPEISFRLEIDQKKTIFTPGDNKFESSIVSLFGTQIFNNLINFSYEDSNIKIAGYFVNPTISKSTRNGYYFYVNRRYIRSKILANCVDEAFKNHIMVNRHPIIFLFVQIEPEEIDVNVHPAKLEVKFRDEKFIFNCIYKAITRRLNSEKMIFKATSDQISQEGLEKKGYVQNDILRTSFLKDDYYNVDKLKEANTYSTSDFEHRLSQNEQLEYEFLNNEQYNENIVNYQSLQDINEPFRLAGYIFETYIIAERGESVYFIDQHAVHERILFNKLQSEIRSNKLSKQILLSPIILELTISQLKFVMENREVFDNLGFELDEFGKNEILVRTVPTVFQDNIDKNFLYDVIDALYDEVQKQGFIDFSDDLLKDIACKMAIKGNKSISDYDKMQIIKKVLVEKEIFNCPHGRPVVIEINKKEIEKMFKRVL